LRGFEYAVLLLACGLALLSVLGRDLPLRMPAVPVAAALLASGVVVVAAEVVVADSGFSAAGILDYLGNGLTGQARVARLVLEAAVLQVAIARRPRAPTLAAAAPAPAARVGSAPADISEHGEPDRPRYPRAQLSPTLLTGIVAAVAVAGHGADVEPAWQGIAVNAAHLAAAAIWAGGIMALGLLRITGQWQAVRSQLLPRFGRVAPWAFGASVVLGAVQAFQLLGGPGQVLSTSYGLTLVAKSVAIAAMVALSLLAWRRIRVSVRLEAVIALVVIAAAAALAAYPVVPKEAGEAAKETLAAGAGTEQSSLPTSGDLTMAGGAGETMVGLTVRPARPGRNTIYAYLAFPATAASRARLQMAGRWRDLTACGTSCRTVSVDLRGGEQLAVAVAGKGGGTAVFHLPALPAKNAAALVSTASQRMRQLRSYRVDELFNGLHSAYIYARPHSIWLRTWYGDGPQDTLWLGSKVYRRTQAVGPWRLESTGVSAPVPYFAWVPFQPLIDSRIVGTSTVSGIPVTVVSGFGGHGPSPSAVWFTLDLDRKTGMVLRSQMWATTHFMADRYYAFNQPPRIPSPDKA
jgi:putative copper export protein